MRLPSFVTLTPRNAPTGKLTLRMICGSRSSPRRWRTRRAARSAQRPVQRERMRGRALLAVGRDDDDLAGRRQRLGELAQALGVDAVVVGDEDAGHVGG